LFLRVAMVLGVACMCVRASPPGTSKTVSGWDLAKIGNRDYVSVDSIRRFYQFAAIKRSGKSISLENPKVVMKLTIDGNECLMNGMKFVFSHPVLEQGGKAYISRVDLSKLIDPVLRPNFIKNAASFQTVILDAGHGGKDPGATNPLGTEARYNLILAEKTRMLLARKGFKVVMTRETDRYLTLQERVNIANSVRDNAIFISIHFNAGGRHARGIETFTLSPPGVSHYGRDLIASDLSARAGNQQDSANIALATAVHGCLLKRLGHVTFDRGVKRARFTVLSGVRHPAILMEGGFMSHPYEARLIHDEKYQNALANGVADAILKYRHAVGRSSAPANARP
jgi:N-acetylmuramoyl-L-alanine amidase